MNNAVVVSEIENHRSRERIKRLGEVFTPDEYVQRLLNILNQNLWSDLDVIFFEPTVGHGNIILPILERRIEALTKKFAKQNVSRPVYHAVANAVNTIWALDICSMNVTLTKQRCFDLVSRTLLTAGFNLENQKNVDFLAHIMCALNWQIQENEVLSALDHAETSMVNASLTKSGREWIKSNSIKKIDFAMPWSAVFESSDQVAIDISYERAKKLINQVALGKSRGLKEFEFAKEGIENILDLSNKTNRTVGAA